MRLTEIASHKAKVSYLQMLTMHLSMNDFDNVDMRHVCGLSEILEHFHNNYDDIVLSFERNMNETEEADNPFEVVL